MKRPILLLAAICGLTATLPPAAVARDGEPARTRERGPDRDEARRELPRRWGEGRRRESLPPGLLRGFRQDAPRTRGDAPVAYRRGPVEDYERYRLRPPPRGFAWVRMGDGFALVGPDGRVFDRVD